MTTKITEKNISNIANAGVDWQAVLTGDGSSQITGVSGRGYFIDNTSGTTTLVLPASPALGDFIAIVDVADSFITNNLTIDRNGNKLLGSDSNITVNANGAIKFYVYSGDTKGWQQTESQGTDPGYVAATGGTILTVGNFKTHVFTGDGTFCVSCAGNPGGSETVDYFVVAGGGSGGLGHGGGGGAGGFRLSNSVGCLPAPTMSPLANGTGITISAAPGSYPVTVGGGGSGANPSPGNIRSGANGSNSVFSTITSAGGGGGVYGTHANGNAGGSGGGGEGGNCAAKAGAGNTPPVSPPQGNPGGYNTQPNPNPGYRNGGGGGAGAAGDNGSGTQSGNGGVGAFISDTYLGPTAPSYGTPGPVSSVRYFAGGGGGGNYGPQNPATSGGCGGAGGGSNVRNESQSANNSTANSGGGAGGGGPVSPGGNGTGGKGIVLIRYKFQAG